LPPLRVSLSTLGREVAELVPDPPEPLRLDRARPNYFLVLSNSCSTCQTIGSGLAAPASRWESAITVLVASDSERHGQEWAASVGLDSPRVFIDDQGKYAKQLGVSSSPTGGAGRARPPDRGRQPHLVAAARGLRRRVRTN
jgi:hypothetical protein